ncbi:hypothetical protein [Vibrio sp. L3-7]|uniref:hypothetical protein n=1 Tax=Vibrio sp. L3-7 TaxID=2912253 RepID=UPI001F303AAF|nr:hypothetical protein [Vibrio sp. L3-7]MCF7505638.1 hypothetical protein [Vibrio sp. L3-7]
MARRQTELPQQKSAMYHWATMLREVVNRWKTDGDRKACHQGDHSDRTFGFRSQISGQKGKARFIKAIHHNLCQLDTQKPRPQYQIHPLPRLTPI